MPDVTDQPVNDVAAARQAFFDQYAQPQPQLPPKAFEPHVSQRQLIDTWNHARNIEQAQKAVDAQMRMLGILRVKAAIEKGVDPAAATYSNLHLLAPAYGKNFSANMKAVAPPPVPRPTNFTFQGGLSIPAVVQGGRTQFVPQSAIPKPAQPIPTEIKEIPIIGPDGKPNPGFFAVPSAGGKGVTTHKRDASTLTQEEQAQAKINLAGAQKAMQQIAEFGANSNIGSNAVSVLKDATNALHNIYNKPAKEKKSGKQITANIARDFLKQAEGDRQKARALAREQGYAF